MLRGKLEQKSVLEGNRRRRLKKPEKKLEPRNAPRDWLREKLEQKSELKGDWPRKKLELKGNWPRKKLTTEPGSYSTTISVFMPIKV